MSTTYAQGKRQKMRERVETSVDYFQGIEKVEYNTMASTTDTAHYRYYNSGERVHSRTMEEWIKCSVSLTQFRSFVLTHKRQWDDGTENLENYKRCIKAFYDFCTKLGIKYWTAFDTDLVPRMDNASWEEGKAHWDEMTEYLLELVQKYHIKPLWIAPDLHSSPRYTHGAFTNPDAATFTSAASIIKRCLEMSQKLACECFLIWPYRECYDALFQTDVQKELKLFAKLLKISTEYKDRLNYRCQMLIMPYDSGNYDYTTFDYRNFGNRNFDSFVNGNKNRVNKYMWDLTSCLYMLKCYSLDRHYKVCTPPGHHMYMANVYNMLGGVIITNDVNHYDNKTFTLMMKCIIDHQGSIPPGGIHLKLSIQEPDLHELVTGYVKYIERIARGLRVACGMATEQMFSKHLQQRYASYYSGFGSRLVSSDVTMEECEDYFKKNQSHTESSKSEHFDVVFQRYMDSFDHV